ASIFKSLLLTELRLPKAIVYYDFSTDAASFPSFGRKVGVFPTQFSALSLLPVPNLTTRLQKGLRFRQLWVTILTGI
ncbi:MAG: hypothetical protein OGMRLDGQ_001163, partial [Candidatus Fervidibacter sp.]